MAENNYSILVSGNASRLFPVHITDRNYLITDNESVLEIARHYPFAGEWGEILFTDIPEQEKYPMPKRIDIIYLSITEKKFFLLEKDLPILRMETLWCHNSNSIDEGLFTNIVIGMAPYGGVALWFRGFHKSILIDWMKAEKTEVSMEDFLPDNENITLEQYCNYHINRDEFVKKNLLQNGLPTKNLFDKYMQQFCYRYLLLFDKWNDDAEEWINYSEEIKPEFDYIEECLYDGTHDKLHDDGLLKFHNAGKPKKLSIRWHIQKSEYTAYLWFEENMICQIFDRFYGCHPETKSDFIIHIDSQNNKYEFALYRYGLKEPVVLPKESYEMIVFKNNFEYYHSENYNQPNGAWIW